MTPNAASPSQRSLHVAVAHRHHMYIFGGYDGGGRVNKFHRFDFLGLTWQEMNVTNAPSPRDRLAGAVVGDSLVIFGGYDGVSRTNDTYVFDIPEERWEQVVLADNDVCPSARHSHSAVAYGGHVYIFGGYDGAYRNDLHKFSVSTGKWSKVQSRGRHPQSRYRASCVINDDRMYVYGGHDGSRHLSDTHVFDFSSSTWSKVETLGQAPIPRDSHAAVMYNRCMFIFGGSSGTAMNDFHYLDLSSPPHGVWCVVPSDGWFPCSRFCHSAVEYDNSMYIFGGYDGHVRLRDFHRFKFAPSVCNVERSTLLDDLASSVGSSFLSDVTFVVEGRPFPAHQVLCSRSANLLLRDESTNRDSNGAIIVDGVSLELFRCIMEYLYTDRISIDSSQMALEVLPFASRFQVSRLKKICISYLSSALSVENAATLFEAAVKSSMDDLRERSLRYMLKHFDLVSRTDTFEEMGRTNVELVFQILRARGDQESEESNPERGWAPDPSGFAPTPIQEQLVNRQENASAGRVWHRVEINTSPLEHPGAHGDEFVVPSNRSLHVMGAYQKALYIFGGYNGDTRVNDFFRFDTLEHRWWRVKNRRVALDEPELNPSEPPSPRDRHSAVVVGERFWVFGGYDGRTRVNDLHAFDFALGGWLHVNVSPFTPSPRHSHSAVALGDKMYIFGGYDGSYKNDLHEFDTSNLQWTRIHTTGTLPSPRYRATTVVHEDHLYLFGGHDGLTHLKDLFCCDLESKVWGIVHTNGISPLPRDSHVAAMFGSYMYVFGGSSGNALNDFVCVRLKRSEPSVWVRVQAGMVPCPRFCHAATVLDNSFYVYGGYDGQQRLNDLIHFNFVEFRAAQLPKSTLVSELSSLVGSPRLSDVKFVVEGKTIHAHKIICSRCSYFEAMFSVGMLESTQNAIEFQDIRHSVFLAMLQYLYTDRHDIELSMAMDLFICADRFGVERLRSMCENKMLSSIDNESVCDYFAASQCHNATNLHDRCFDYIVRNFDVVSKTESFERMGRGNIDLVFAILQGR